MSIHLILWGLIFGMLGVTTLFAVWSREDTWVRSACLGIFLLGFLTVPATYTETLGLHKPFSLAWDIEKGDYRVLAAKLVQGQGIYLYIDYPVNIIPRPLSLPWDNETADRIQKLIHESQKNKQNGEFMMRYEGSLDIGPPQFHPLPQPPMLPPKGRPQPAPHLEGEA